MNEPKKIKPHKGGRTERFTGRLTPEEKKRLNVILKKEHLSLSDLLMGWVGVLEHTYSGEKNFTYLVIDRREGWDE